MSSKVFYYARVSSKNQSLARQIERFKAMGADDRDIITEKESGKNFEDRPAYQTLRNQLLRPGDTIIVVSLDRLGRNKCQIKKEIEYFKDNNIRLKVLDIPTTMMDYPEGQEWVMDMVNSILIEVLGSMAEQERENIRERQAQGIEVAKKSGSVKFGRPQAQKPDNWEAVYSRWQAGEITAVKAMEETGLTRSTFYKFAKEGQ